MNKDTYLKKLDELNLDKNRYCIFAGGILLMYDIKCETSDLDLVINDQYLMQLQHIYHLTKIKDDKYALNDEVEFIIMDTNLLTVEIVDGYPVYPLKLYKEILIESMRPKDSGKIELIDTYISQKKLGESYE